MPIVVSCACGKRLRAREEQAGKRAKCPACGAVVQIPEAASQEPNLERREVSPAESDSYRLEDPPEPRVEQTSPRYPSSDKAADEPARPLERRRRRVATRKPTRASTSAEATAPARLHYTYWVFALTLIPLCLALLQKEEGRYELEGRLERTLQKASGEVKGRVARVMTSGTATLDDLLTALPDERLDGAHLSRNSKRHWFYALVALVVFFSLIVLLSVLDAANPLGLVGITLFTATVGVFLLLAFQFLAEWTQGVWLVGRSIFLIIFYIAKFIGFSYQAALDPENGFFLSFFGFTCGVGLCEELVKAMPLLWHFRGEATLTWRGALLWGLASGVGFGISEGIMYAGDQYNGIAGPGAYIVRFISCVGLHAIWTGTVGVTFYRCRDLVQQEVEWPVFITFLGRILGVAIVLHGLYDTLLKKEMNLLALLVAVVSFAWFAWQIEACRREEGEESSLAMARA